jgi:hypothetical protein
VAKNIDAAIAQEQAVEKLAELRSRLAAAARDDVELVLTSGECLILSHHVVDPVRPKGRPPVDLSRRYAIAMRCFKLQRSGGVSLKDAAAATAKEFGCSVASVHAAMAKRRSK